MNSVNSGGASREKRKGGKGGDAGLFIAGSSLQERLGFERWRDRTMQRAAGLGLVTRFIPGNAHVEGLSI
jgi:hypothetical protein